MFMSKNHKKYACENQKDIIFSKYLSEANKIYCKKFGVAKFAKILMYFYNKKLKRKIKNQKENKIEHIKN